MHLRQGRGEGRVCPGNPRNHTGGGWGPPHQEFLYVRGRRFLGQIFPSVPKGFPWHGGPVISPHRDFPSRSAHPIPALPISPWASFKSAFPPPPSAEGLLPCELPQWVGGGGAQHPCLALGPGPGGRRRPSRSRSAPPCSPRGRCGRPTTCCSCPARLRPPPKLPFVFVTLIFGLRVEVGWWEGKAGTLPRRNTAGTRFLLT